MELEGENYMLLPLSGYLRNICVPVLGLQGTPSDPKINKCRGYFGSKAVAEPGISSLVFICAIL